MLVIKYDDALDVMTRYYQAAEDEVEAIIVQLWADMKKLAVEPKAELLFELLLIAMSRACEVWDEH